MNFDIKCSIEEAENIAEHITVNIPMLQRLVIAGYSTKQSRKTIKDGNTIGHYQQYICSDISADAKQSGKSKTIRGGKRNSLLFLFAPQNPTYQRF